MASGPPRPDPLLPPWGSRVRRRHRFPAGHRARSPFMLDQGSPPHPLPFKNWCTCPIGSLHNWHHEVLNHPSTSVTTLLPTIQVIAPAYTRGSWAPPLHDTSIPSPCPTCSCLERAANELNTTALVLLHWPANSVPLPLIFDTGEDPLCLLFLPIWSRWWFMLRRTRTSSFIHHHPSSPLRHQLADSPSPLHSPPLEATIDEP
jgi:hypothetical protein